MCVTIHVSMVSQQETNKISSGGKVGYGSHTPRGMIGALPLGEIEVKVNAL